MEKLALKDNTLVHPFLRPNTLRSKEILKENVLELVELIANLEVGAPARDVSNQLALLDSRTRPLIYFHVLSLRNDFGHSRQFNMTALNSI